MINILHNYSSTCPGCNPKIAPIKSVYLIGSLRNPKIPELANQLERELGIEVFDNWFSAGETADDSWRDYEILRGRNFGQALKGYSARHVFEFDFKHIERCDAAILYMPAGKSGHLELGYALGRGKKGFILFDALPDRWDVMYRFATEIFFDRGELFNKLKGEK